MRQNPGDATRVTREPVLAPVSGRTDGRPAHPVAAWQALSRRYLASAISLKPSISTVSMFN